MLLETEEAVAPRWQPAQRPGGGVIRKARPGHTGLHFKCCCPAACTLSRRLA